jgi:2-polyprenyl-3-methyl-5-hydroxy-6-metoxy-1,4-benzoquinol methylase
MAELRPDLKFASVDISGQPEHTPRNTDFARADLETDRLPWPDRSFDSITCMHVIEHLRSADNLWREVARLLKPGGRVYMETPGPESVATPSPPDALRGKVTLNFYDDPTHIAPVPVAALVQGARSQDLVVVRTGRSRNWLFVAAYPVLALLGHTRKRYVAKLHWTGWSAYLVAERPLR